MQVYNSRNYLLVANISRMNNKTKDKKQGGTYIAPMHQMRKEKETIDRNGNIVKRSVEEPRKK